MPIPSGTAAGNYYVIAVADADHGVLEANEANNATAKLIAITAP
jgi:subtilase family serine protease